MLIYLLVAFLTTDKISHRDNFRAFSPSGFQEITAHQPCQRKHRSWDSLGQLIQAFITETQKVNDPYAANIYFLLS